MWALILCYKNQGIHWYHCNPTFLWKTNFRLVRRLISALIWDISGQWNRSDGQDFREKLIVFSRFLALYISHAFMDNGVKWGLFVRQKNLGILIRNHSTKEEESTYVDRVFYYTLLQTVVLKLSSQFTQLWWSRSQTILYFIFFLNSEFSFPNHVHSLHCGWKWV